MNPELPLEETFHSFDAEMDHLQESLIAAAFSDDESWTDQIRRTVFKSLMLLLVAEWESLCTNMLVILFGRDSSQYAAVTGYGVSEVLPAEECKAIVNGTGYFSFSNMDDMVGKSRKFITDSNNAFNALTIDDRKFLNHLIYIRNAIVHDSVVSRRKLRKVYDEVGHSRLEDPEDFLTDRLGTYVLAIWDAEERMRQFLGFPNRIRGGEEHNALHGIDDEGNTVLWQELDIEWAGDGTDDIEASAEIGMVAFLQ